MVRVQVGNGTSIPCGTKNIKSSVFNYSDAYIFVTDDITAQLVLQIVMLLSETVLLVQNHTHIKDEKLDTAESIDFIMPMFNWIEYRDNYSDTTGRPWQFKRNEQPITDDGISSNVNNLSLLKQKSSTLGTPASIGNNGVLNYAKIAVAIKYLNIFWRSLERPLIKCKIHFEMSWTKNCVMPIVAGLTEFKITNTKLYVPIVPLSTEDNVKLTL